MTIKLKLMAVLAIIMLCACKTTPPYNPYKVEKNEIIQVKRIALMPVGIFIEVDDEAKQEAFFHDELVTRFTDKGFTVIPAQEWRNIYEPLKKSSGELYDPTTGKPNKEKLKAVREQARAVYIEKFTPDAFLYSGVMPVKAEWHHNNATWDGHQAPTTGVSGFWADFTSPQAYGTVGALSFFINIEDRNQRDLFVEFGGLQLLQHVGHGGFTPRPKTERLVNEQENSNSVNLASCRFFELWQPPVKNKKGKVKSCRK